MLVHPGYFKSAFQHWKPGSAVVHLRARSSKTVTHQPGEHTPIHVPTLLRRVADPKTPWINAISPSEVQRGSAIRPRSRLRSRGPVVSPVADAGQDYAKSRSVCTICGRSISSSERRFAGTQLSAAPPFSDNPVVAECVNCGAPMLLDRQRGVLVCDHCGSEQEAPAVIEHLELLGVSTSLCPMCLTPLSRSRLEGHSLLYCARCYGMLIEMNRFATLIDAVRASEERPRRVALPRRQNPGDRLLNCPTCGQPMLCHIYGGPGNVVI